MTTPSLHHADLDLPASHDACEAPALSVRSLSKSFGTNVALNSFDIDIAAGEIHALIGENGSGKSTFIKILAGYHQPDPGGEVRVGGEPIAVGSSAAAYAAGCRFVHQDLGLIGELPVLDNLCLGAGFPTRLGTIRRRVARKNALRSLELVGGNIDPESLVNALTPAQRTAVALARSITVDKSAPVKLVIFDEPTATLPDNEVENLLALVRRVASNGVAVLYVTHRLDEIFQVASNVTVLRDGSKVAAVPVQGLSRRDVVHLLVGDELDEAEVNSRKLAADEYPVRLRVDQVESATLASLTFDARAHEIVGLAGITGSGRETALRTVFGDLERVSGRVELDGRPLQPHRIHRTVTAGVAYVPPDRKTLGAVVNLSAGENLLMADVRRTWRFPRMRRESERREVEEWCERFDVRPRGEMEKPLASFSGGNQQKVILAKWFRLKPAVILLDEPTQGVDVGAKAVIYRQLVEAAESGCAVVVSSSDVDELAALCHRVLIMRDGSVVQELHHSDVT
ncbi:sugar ABC transporter ATP-binding protein, partial [Pseudofrankia asymbiotica]